MVRLTKGSLAQRSVVLLLSLLAIGLGVYAAGALKQELIPSIDLPRGSVLTLYPGASPDVVEAQVTKPIESAVKSVNGVSGVTSTSSSGVSQVTVQWDYGFKPDDMANKLRSAIDSISGTLPSAVDPKVITGSFDDIPIIVLAVSSDADVTTLTSEMNQTVVPKLKGIPGVRDASVAGQETHEIVISYSPATFNDKGIDPSTVAQLYAANANAMPSGTIRSAGTNLDVQTGRTFASAAQIANLQIPTADGAVRLGDVATVVEQPVETTSISRVNGKSSLTVSITKDSQANTVSVSHAVNDMLPELQKQLGNGATFTVFFDQAPYIEQSIHDLSVEGGIGLAMAVLVIMIFLGSIRPTIITAISIPMSLLIALIGLWMSGFTLNILTLAALTVAIGRVVDDSIVVIENIKRHQSHGEKGYQSIITAVGEVAGAVTSSTLTTVAVFAPIGLVGGQAGEIFRPFAFTVTIALLASLLVALTVVPVLASWFMKPRKQAALARSEVPALPVEKDTLLQRAYLPALNWSLTHRWITVGLAVFLFVATLAATPFLKTDFLGDQGDESLMISQKLPAGSSLTQTDAAARKVEKVLAANPAVQTYSTSIGGDMSAFLGGQSDTNQASYTVPLKTGYSAKEVVSGVRADLAALGPAIGTVDVSVGNSTNSVVVYVEGSDPVKLKAANDKVTAMMKTIPGLVNVSSDLSEGREQISVNVDNAAAADLGMSQASIGQAVSRAVRGQLIGTMPSGDDTLNVYLRVKNPATSIATLRKIELPVTQTMNANAMTADSKAALKKSKAQSQKAVTVLTKQLGSLQQQLAAFPAKCMAAPTDPACQPIAAGMAQLTQAMAAVQSQLGQAQAGVIAADQQLKSLDSGSASGMSGTAKPVRLNAVATVTTITSPASITRVDGTRAATITASSESTDLGATTAQIQAGLAALDLPDGITYRIGGVSQQQTDSFQQLGLAMLVAIAVVYLIMVATFGSLLQPLVLLVSIPFAATGALGLSLVTNTPLGLPSMIGLLMLIGIVVTNAIVLIDLINQKRKSGLGVSDSIQAGARLRVRPIVMTALATVFALTPMALGFTGGGVFISKPLAIVVIGGLISSTALTLILVPVLYDLLESWRERRANRKASA